MTNVLFVGVIGCSVQMAHRRLLYTLTYTLKITIYTYIHTKDNYCMQPFINMHSDCLALCHCPNPRGELLR